MYLVLGSAEIYRSAHVAYLLDGNAAVKKCRYSQNDILAHSVGQNIRAAVNEYRAADVVCPIIVVSKAAQRGFKSAYYYRNIAVSLAYAVAVNYRGSVGALSCLSTGGIIV